MRSLLYCVFLLAINHELPGALVWLPVLLIPQILFTAGVSWFLAALGVFVRDLGQIMGFVLTLWFFLTPICYPENKLPHAAAGAADQESDLRSGARLPVDFLAESGTGVRRGVEAVAGGDGGVSAGPRLVLQVAKVVPGYAVKYCKAARRAADIEALIPAAPCDLARRCGLRFRE